MARWNNADRTPLARLRANAGFSAEKAAPLLGTIMMTLYRYEKGISELPLSVAEKMASLYAVPFDEIRLAARQTKKKNEVKQ
ncbi:MAG: helix-turn-helix transcriptional regulator [Synergistaceae bacterium]|nr:helix-turn-helix transcriptional regulator [Synergistaceae bacterium]MBR0079060.1 helix-turn-helix transcriptional regulator [Synergistaceae bacterium]MBR0234077.1 helix-turn-helix transcriptional regulator [Synergistaceae bacterium]MBR0253540.1 helix-turn-helix transcriptional regulator [Synergistaceae bacterium]